MLARGKTRRRPVQLVAVIVIFAAMSADGAQYFAGPSDYRKSLGSLAPGDTLTLRAGIYREGLPIHRLKGTADARIVIQGSPSSDTPTIFYAQPGANTVSLIDSSYVTLRDLRIDGRHLPVDGIKAEGTSGPIHHVTLERLTLINQDQAQDIIAISAQCIAWGWIIRDNVIVGAGTGMYLGTYDGTAPFFDAIIEGNAIVDTIGYNVEIKHQIGRPEVPGLPMGNRGGTVIRNNIFSKARNGSSGKSARPNLLVGHFPLHDAGQGDRYDIRGNVFFDNPDEALFQGEGNVTLAENVFFNPHGDAIVLQPHHDRPRNISIVDNVIVAERVGIRLSGTQSDDPIAVIGNRIYANGGTSGITAGDNAATRGEAPVDVAKWLPVYTGSTSNNPREVLPALTRRVCALMPNLSQELANPLCAFLHSLFDLRSTGTPRRR